MDGGREFQVWIDACGKERRMVLFDRGGRVRLNCCVRWILALVAVYADGGCDMLAGAVVAAAMERASTTRLAILPPGVRQSLLAGQVRIFVKEKDLECAG